jgi:hypothetical protein
MYQQPPNQPPYQPGQQSYQQPPFQPQPPYQPQRPMMPPGPPMPPPPPRKQGWSAKTWGIIIAIIFFMGGIGWIMDATGVNKQPTPTQTAQQAAPTTAPTPTQKPPTRTQKPVEKMNITVTSLIVKKVDGQYRYFFDVRNHDKKPWSGSATIELYNDKQETSVGSNTFETTSPMQPGLGTSVYFDINTGPHLVHGEYGITHFKYSIKIQGQESNKGAGKISDKYSDSSI